MSQYDAAVITSIYDGYDDLKPVCPQKGMDVDWVFVTDNPEAVAPSQELGWRVILNSQPDLHPNRAAKLPKLLPWEYTTADRSIWVDGSFRVTSETFVEDAMSFADPIGQFIHPWRDCLFAEAEECIALGKYESPVLRAQTDSYRIQDHPEHWGLWASGVMARVHTPEVMELGESWLREVNFWSYRDQISQPFVLRTVGLRPTKFPGMHLDNGWLQYEGSKRH